MPKQVAAPTGKEVEIAVALSVPDFRSLASHKAGRVPLVIGDDMLREDLDDLLG
jgi:hypothetical protein